MTDQQPIIATVTPSLDSDPDNCSVEFTNPSVTNEASNVESISKEIENAVSSDEQTFGRGLLHPVVFIVDPLATTPPPLGEFPKDDLNTALHSDQVTENFTERANKLIEWLNGRNSAQAVTELLRAHNSPDCEKWLAHIEPDALKPEFDEGVRLYLVKRALHLSFLTIQDEDISNVLMAINAPDTGHVWFAMFERQVIPVMIRLGL